MADNGDKGCFIAIVGPSGSGKDTLIGWLRDRLGERPDILFVKRAVTRPAVAALEDHDSLSEGEFAAVERAGGYAVVWNAHGLRYGIPAAALDHVRAGGIAIANGSRRALDRIAVVFGTLIVVELTVERAELARRLAARGRETPDEIEKRLSRAAEPLPFDCGIVRIDNSGAIEQAGEAFLAMLRDELAIEAKLSPKLD